MLSSVCLLKLSFAARPVGASWLFAFERLFAFEQTFEQLSNFAHLIAQLIYLAAEPIHLVSKVSGPPAFRGGAQLSFDLPHACEGIIELFFELAGFIGFAVAYFLELSLDLAGALAQLLTLLRQLPKMSFVRTGSRGFGTRLAAERELYSLKLLHCRI